MRLMDMITYAVVGMTCDHCVRSVREEVGAIDGVRRVDVDLVSGRVDVTSDGPVRTDFVEAAVVEAGFSLRADPPR